MSDFNNHDITAEILLKVTKQVLRHTCCRISGVAQGATLGVAWSRDGAGQSFFALFFSTQRGILGTAYPPSLCENMLNSGGFSFLGWW